MGTLECRIALDGPALDERVVRFEFREALSEPFVGDVVFESTDPELDLETLLFTPVLLRLSEEGRVVRAFGGSIEQATYLGEYRHGIFHYRVRILPRVHALSYRVRSRILQNMDVLEAVKHVLTDAGIDLADVEFRTEHPGYPKREYITQYKESDLAFLRRLLADQGIFFWFEHDDVGHLLHLADSASVREPIEPEVLYTDHTAAWKRQWITDLRFGTRMVSDAYSMRDWDWRSPAAPVEGQFQGETSLGLEHYAYPGGCHDPVDAGRHSTDRLRTLELGKYRLQGRSNHLGLCPGRTFFLEGARPGFLNRGFLLLSCVHSYVEKPGSTASDGRELAFQTRFVATHDDQEYRPARRPKPRALGMESAVIASAGEEIHVDRYGRVKLHLHWDRESPMDDSASCWIRVQQQNLSGSMLLPRLGWEVAVGFENGDPDRPVVLQKLYNRETLPPYELPANLSQSALQSSSSPGGGGSNELRLQDSGGGQDFFMHAQKDLVLGVGNDQNETIALDLSESFDNTLVDNVGSDETISIGANQDVTVQGSLGRETGANETVTVGAVDDWSVQGVYTQNVGGDRSETIAGVQGVTAVSSNETFTANHVQTVGGVMGLTARAAMSEAVVGNKVLSVGGAHVIKVKGAFGEQTAGAKVLAAGATTYKAGGAFNLSAAKTLSIEVGGAVAEKVKKAFGLSAKKLTVKAPDGAQIKAGGTKLTLKGGKLKLDGSSFGAKAGPMLSLKGKISFK